MFSSLLEAITFAAQAHVNQRRKNREAAPYINHPLNVAAILAQAGVVDIDVLRAAVLHDTVEDTATTLDDLRRNFGEKVASIVQECSDDKSLPKAERKRLQIEHVKQASYEARLVKLADKLDNLRSLVSDPPAGWTPGIIKGYAVWSHAVIAEAGETNTFLKESLERVLAHLGVQTDKPSAADELEEYYARISE